MYKEDNTVNEPRELSMEKVTEVKEVIDELSKSHIALNEIKSIFRGSKTAQKYLDKVNINELMTEDYAYGMAIRYMLSDLSKFEDDNLHKIINNLVYENTKLSDKLQKITELIGEDIVKCVHEKED